MGEPRIVRLGPNDNAVVALDEIRENQRIVAEDVVARATIPAGHKMATAAIAAGKPVRKFSQIIGFATSAIGPGEHVHTHNCAFAAFERDYAHSVEVRDTAFVADAAVVHVPAGVDADRPVHIVHVATPGAEPRMSHPRGLIVAETGSRVTVVETFDDHRVAMSFAVLGLRRSGLSVADPQVVEKSYPGFWRQFADCTQERG